MCTAIMLQSQQQESFFGRNMDFSHNIQPHLYMIPKNFAWNNVLTLDQIRDDYSFIGIGQELDGLLGFFDGVNEKGFAAAALYFAGYAEYHPQPAYQDLEQIASFDFLHYILGKCSSIDNLYALLENISIIGVQDPVTQTVAPLHWIASDRSGQCVVIELTKRGFEFFDNPIGVMANSPDFQWHMTNLRNYTEVSPKQISETFWGNIPLVPFGQAAGTSSLPGGYTSPERFVRTSYLKTHLPTPKDPTEAIVSCFHIMEGVSIPRGAVLTDRNTYDYTKYTAFINTNTCEYFFKTYDNPQIATARLCADITQPINLGPIVRPVVFEKIGEC